LSILTQNFGKRVGRQGPAVEIALAFGAAIHSERLVLGLGLDALGECRSAPAEMMRCATIADEALSI
jgi:hypothetical protein